MNKNIIYYFVVCMIILAIGFILSPSPLIMTDIEKVGITCMIMGSYGLGAIARYIKIKRMD